MSFQYLNKFVRNAAFGMGGDQVLTKVDSDNYCGQGEINRKGTPVLFGSMESELIRMEGLKVKGREPSALGL